MKEDVVVIMADDPVWKAASLMAFYNTGALPVSDQTGRLVGLVTADDISRRVVAENRPARTRVEDIMRAEVVAVRRNDPLEAAEALMARQRMNRISVVDDNGLFLGSVVSADLNRALELGEQRAPF